MLHFSIRRTIRGILTLWVVVSAVFVVLRISGEPAQALLPEDATPEQIERFNQSFGLDQPIPVQYGKYLASIAPGRLRHLSARASPGHRGGAGTAGRDDRARRRHHPDRPAARHPGGILAAVWHNSTWDHLLMGFAFVGQSMPNFFIGILLILLFALELRLLPSSGRGGIQHLILPAFTLATALLAGTARMTRSSMLEVIRQEYVRTARAKGLANRQVLIRDCLRNAAVPVVTLVGLQLGVMIGGAAITETVFAWLRQTPILIWACLAVLCVFLFCAVFADVLAPHDPTTQDLRARLRPPLGFGGTTDYPLGTDPLGRDVLSRLLFGARVSLAIGAGGLAAAFLVACGGSTEESTSTEGTPAPAGAAPATKQGSYSYAPKTGKSREAMTVGVAGLPAGMDPANELSNVGTRVTYSVYDTLVRRDFLDDNKLKPALAASWERTDDLTLTAKLRRGVTFHNGDPMTAEDVKYTFERILRPDSSLADAQGYFDTFDAIEVVDPTTVRIKTKAPDPLVEKRIASWASWIVPKAHIERTGGDKEFGQHGMGTGPYKVTRFTADDRLVLERYDGHWEEKPPLRQLTFRVIPETAARTTALVTGEVQIVTNVPPDQVKTLQETSGVEARSILDQQRRPENYQQMLDIWEKEAPGTVLYVPVENYGVSKDVNWSPYPFYYMDLRAYNLSFNK